MKFFNKMRFHHRVPWEILGALGINVLALGALLVCKSPPLQVVVPAEISVDVTDFKPPEIKEMAVPEQLASGAAGSVTAPAADTVKPAENVMRVLTPQIAGGLGAGEKTASERFGELERVERRMQAFGGVNQLKSGLPTGTLPAGLETGASFKGRGDAKNRSRLLQRHGGGSDTESAVGRALQYLASVQNKNGSWGSPESFKSGDAVALTGLSLLAFFSHGENFQSEKYSDNIRRGCDFLVEMSNTPNIEYAGSGFGHAILTYALAEGYAVSGSMSLRGTLEQRLKFILSRQNSFGSFALNYDNTPMAPPTAAQQNDPKFKEVVVGEPACDLSLLGWHIQAMTAARNAGIRIDGLDKALELAAEALVKIHQADKGGFSTGINMKRFSAEDNMNPVGLLGLQLLNAGNSSPGRRAEKLLYEVPAPKWKQSGKFPLYRWYYQTQSLFQAEKGRGDRWEAWNTNLKTELLAVQRADGGWPLPGGDTSFRVRDATDLSIYGTSLCALMLQVYYRYQPGYSIAESSGFSNQADNYDLGGGRLVRLPGGADPLAAVLLGVGDSDFEPVRFGQFDGVPAESSSPLAEKEFALFAALRSTIPVRKPEAWPQTLQPNQRLALFLDDLIPRTYKGHLRLLIGAVGSKKAAFENRQALEVVLNGKRLYNSYLLREKQLIEVILPLDVMQPYGNILQIRNNGQTVLAFDAARLEAPGKVGPRLHLLAENRAELPPSLRPLFGAEQPKEAKYVRLSGNAENRRLLPEIAEYDSTLSYIAEFPASGSEYMGDEFQLHYLRQTAREIVDWIADGGSGVKLDHIMDGGRLYDSVFHTEYPALSALRQAAKLFDGAPHRLSAQYYPKYGEKPQIFGNAAAAYNAPGVATLLVTKRFPIPEEGEVVAVVPWSGPTEMTIESGLLPEHSPFAGLAGKIQSETKTVQLENNLFRYSAVFPELTVIRLVKKGAKPPEIPPVIQRDVTPEVAVDFTAVKNSIPSGEGELSKHPLRSGGGFVAAYGSAASFSRIPATKVEEGSSPFTPEEPQSLLVTFRTNAEIAGRNDSVYLALGKSPVEKPRYLTFRVFPRAAGLKKDAWFSTQLRFVLDGKCFSIGVAAGRWQQIVLPLEGVDPSWRQLRILAPGRVTERNLQSVSYEINDIAVFSK